MGLVNIHIPEDCGGLGTHSVRHIAHRFLTHEGDALDFVSNICCSTMVIISTFAACVDGGCGDH